MRATHRLEITRKVSYNDPQQRPDEVRYFASERELVWELDAQGVPGKSQRKGWDQFSGYRLVWGPLAADEVVFLCDCGYCDQAVTTEGKFRPGHDAKLVGNLLRTVRSGVTTRQDALSHWALASRPKLRAKLLRLLGDD